MTQPSEHLGPIVVEGDPATWFPGLWTWLVQDLEVRSVLDVGCGAGHALNFFEGLGCRVQGIEGVPQEDSRILEWDYTRGPLFSNDEFDLVWSCEFVEHVEDEHVGNFMETIHAGKLVLMTHAEPGQPGHHHVNCEPSGYWLEKFEEAGFEFDPALTIEARRRSLENDYWWRDNWCSEHWWGFHLNHFVRSGLAFRRV